MKRHLTWRVILIAMSVSLVATFLYAEEKKEDAPWLHPAPDWVHPQMRSHYPGYEKQPRQKSESRQWQYQTNRPRGNIRGGGTTAYQDYKPFFDKRLSGTKTNDRTRR